MADNADPDNQTVAFTQLYHFENETLKECPDLQRKQYLSRFKPQLWGDGDLQMNCAKRSAFSEDVKKAIREMKAAWAASSLSGSYDDASYWDSVTFSVGDYPEASVEGVLGVAGEFESFLHFGSLTNGEVADDGSINMEHAGFTDTSVAGHESAMADLQVVQDDLHGNVLSAWFDEDAAELQIQVVAGSDENDGNERLFFILTEKRAYVFDFSTS